jgi:hypothetical protein
MRKRHVLAVAMCGGLAACGGVHAVYSGAYDRQAAEYSGPVDVVVAGPSDSGIASGSIVTAAVGAMSTLGVQARAISTSGFSNVGFRPGDSAAGYRLIVVYGPAAERLAKYSDRDYGQGLCTALNSASALQVIQSGSGSGGNTPVLAVLCQQNIFQTLAYETVDGTGPAAEQEIRAGMPKLVKIAFPDRWMLGRDIGGG